MGSYWHSIEQHLIAYRGWRKSYDAPMEKCRLTANTRHAVPEHEFQYEANAAFPTLVTAARKYRILLNRITTWRNSPLHKIKFNYMGDSLNFTMLYAIKRSYNAIPCAIN
jgi:hypothetical protein